MEKLLEQTLKIIEDKFIKVLYVNLTDDTFKIVKASQDELSDERCYSDSFSKWFSQSAKCGYVHFNDLDSFLNSINLDYLRQHFNNNDDKLGICYRRALNDTYIWAKIEITKTENYTLDNQEVCLYVLNINDTVFAINKKEHQLEEKLSIQERDNEILKSLANVYYSIHLIDLNNDTISEIRGNQDIRDYINKNSYANLQLKIAMDNLIVPSYVDKALRFVDLDTLLQRMGTKSIITEELFSKNVGWVRVNFIAVKDENNNLNKVLFVIRVIDEEKRREESLIQYSYTDGLTKLYNRRAYDNDLINIKKKTYEELCILVIDANGLKQINDTYGHQAGDEFIRDTATIISEVFTSVGRCYRTGGDEFVVIAAKSKIEMCKRIIKLNQLLAKHIGNYPYKMTVSVGYASIEDYPSLSIEELEKIADKKMYENKKLYYDGIGQFNHARIQ